MKINLVGISGSLRRHSYNSALLRAAATEAPDGCLVHSESIASIPLYDGDLESAGMIPEAVRRLKDAIARADGLLIFSPEYNHSYPGVAKNAIDWLSRPPADARRVFGGKPVAIAGATPGGFGTVLAQSAWLPVFHTLGAQVWSGGSFIVSHAASAFDESGQLTDPAVREALRKFLSGFAAHVAALKPAPALAEQV